MSRRKPAAIASSAIHRKVGALAIVAAIGVALMADDSPETGHLPAPPPAAAPKPAGSPALAVSKLASFPDPAAEPNVGVSRGEPVKLAPARPAAVAARPVIAGGQSNDSEPAVKGMPRPGYAGPQREAAPSPRQIETLIAESRRNAGSEGRGD